MADEIGGTMTDRDVVTTLTLLDEECQNLHCPNTRSGGKFYEWATAKPVTEGGLRIALRLCGACAFAMRALVNSAVDAVTEDGQ